MIEESRELENPQEYLALTEELELLALRKGIHVLGSHRFAMQNENKSSYVRLSIASPNTEDDLKKGLLILKNIFREKQMHFFV